MGNNLDQIMMAGSNLPVSLWVNSLSVDDKPIATEAVYECLRQNFPINLLELGRMVRLLKRKQRANG